jgi:hypothetical protein
MRALQQLVLKPTNKQQPLVLLRKVKLPQQSHKWQQKQHNSHLVAHQTLQSCKQLLPQQWKAQVHDELTVVISRL